MVEGSAIVVVEVSTVVEAWVVSCEVVCDVKEEQAEMISNVVIIRIVSMYRTVIFPPELDCNQVRRLCQ